MSPITPSPLIKLAGAYDIGKGLKSDRYYGPVLGGPDAFYLIIVKRLTLGHLAGAALGGAAGFVAGEIMAGDAAKSAKNVGAQVSQVRGLHIPTAVRQNPAWPKEHFDKQVIVIPKEVVTEITYSFWTYFSINTADQVFRIGLTLFGRRRILNGLREMGWQF